MPHNVQGTDTNQSSTVHIHIMLSNPGSIIHPHPSLAPPYLTSLSRQMPPFTPARPPPNSSPATHKQQHPPTRHRPARQPPVLFLLVRPQQRPGRRHRRQRLRSDFDFHNSMVRTDAAATEMHSPSAPRSEARMVQAACRVDHSDPSQTRRERPMTISGRGRSSYPSASCAKPHFEPG
jgi:hypothetical protein